jgi:hypothetical protein
MGVAVKTLLLHLRERQERLGVRAFHFHHVLRNNALESAHYPDTAQAVLDSEDPEDLMDLTNVNTSKKEEMARANFSPWAPLLLSQLLEKQSNNP